MSKVREATGDFSYIEIEIADTYTDEEGVTRWRDSSEVATEARTVANAFAATHATGPQQQPRPATNQNRPQQQQGGAQRPQQGQQQRQQGESRADRFPLVVGWNCDICKGPVGRRAATGNMQSDSAVCLSKCNDDAGNGRTWVHSVGWLDETPVGVEGDLDPDNLPF